MGLLSTLLGRTKPVQSNLDSLFALPSASITLQSAAGLTCSGHAGVCYKPPSGQGFEDMQAEVVTLLTLDGSTDLRQSQDTFGYHWLVVEDADINQLVTRIHMVNSSLADAGWGPQLLCSVFGIGEEPADRQGGDDDTGSGLIDQGAPMPEVESGPGRVIPSTGYLVYLFKRGTFYPFVPDGHEHRDTELEFRLKSLIGDDLTVESELDRWFPLWDLPVG